MSPRAALYPALALVLGTTLPAPPASSLAAQGATPPAALDPWSPLVPVGDLVHELPGLHHFPALLTEPAPRSGLHWTVGNPAGLAFELTAPRQEFRMGRTRSEGDYRRPLDPARVDGLGFGGNAWQPLDGTGGLVGRIAVARNAMDDAFANTAFPYTSSPHTVMDTSGTALGQSVARIEGAGGWRIGRWGLGLSAGYETLDTRTRAAPIARHFRYTRPAATAGVARDLGATRIGLHARWQGGSQTTQLAPRQGIGTVRAYRIRAFDAPRMIELDQGFFTQVARRRATAVGVSAAGAAGPLAWTAYAETAALRENQAISMENDPPLDTWVARGGAGGLALAMTLAEGRLELFGDARFQWLSGEAGRADLDDIAAVYEAAETRALTRAELRYLPGAGWTAAVRLTAERTARDRQDHVVRLAFDHVGWSAGAAVEVARDLTDRLALAGAVGGARFTPMGSLPNPEAAGPALRRYVSPELMLAGTPSTALGASLTGLWRRRAGGGIWIRGRYDTSSPEMAGSRLPLAPEGDRSGWGLELGMRLH